MGDLHTYQRDPQSGAGNCTCGGQYEHRRHPHPFRPTDQRDRDTGSALCVCALSITADCHLATGIDPSAFSEATDA